MTRPTRTGTSVEQGIHRSHRQADGVDGPKRKAPQASRLRSGLEGGGKGFRHSPIAPGLTGSNVQGLPPLPPTRRLGA